MTVPFRILLVEDDQDVRYTLSEILRDDGYAVDVACDGVEALAYLRSGNAPGVILLDLMMPRMSGFDFRVQQLADHTIEHIPVIILTALGRMDEAAVSLKAEAAIGKPIDMPKLISALENVRANKDFDEGGPGGVG